MDCVGLSSEERADLFRVVAAVLHLGNISFDENTSDKKGGATFRIQQIPEIRTQQCTTIFNQTVSASRESLQIAFGHHCLEQLHPDYCQT